MTSFLVECRFKNNIKICFREIETSSTRFNLLQQTAYVKNRNIGESGNLISDEIEITEVKDIEGFLVTVDIEKALDLLDHDFLVSSLEKYGFAQNFILWVNILLKDQESWVINGGKTTKYFLLGRGTH